MKKYIKPKKILALLIILILLVANIMPITSMAATTHLHKISNVVNSNGKINNDYAFGTMFYTKDTKITGKIGGKEVNITDGMMDASGNVPEYYYEVQKFGNTYNNVTGSETANDKYDLWNKGGEYRDLANLLSNTEERSTDTTALAKQKENEKDTLIYVYGLKATQGLELTISNCAIDEDGDLCDVVATVKLNTIDNGDYSTTENGKRPFNNWLGRDFLHTNLSGYTNGVYDSTFSRKNFYSQYYLEQFNTLSEDEKNDRLTNGGMGERKDSLGYQLTSTKFEDIPRGLVAVTNDQGLVSFTFMTNFASGDFDFEYYKSGTNQKTKANITNVLSMINDVDVQGNASVESAEANYETFQDTAFVNGGNETISIEQGDMYYNDALLTGVESGDKITVYKNDTNVDTVQINKWGVTTNQYNSLIMTQDFDNKDKTQFKFHYSAIGCGIGYRFLAPFETEIPKPVKEVNTESAFEEDNVEFTISQYIPNNYFYYNTKFAEVFFGKTTTTDKTPSIKITDQFDSNIEVDFNNIRITNEKDKDVSSYFDLSNDGKTLTATVKNTALQNMDFYNHTYNIIVPGKIVKDAGTKVTNGKITNKAKTIITVVTTGEDGDITTELETNTVTVKLKYIDVVNGVIDHGIIQVNGKEEGTTSTDRQEANWGDTINNTVTFSAEDGYKVVSVSVDGKKIALGDIEKKDGQYIYYIKDENIKSDIEHNVVVKTALKNTKVIAMYVDEDGNEIADSEIINGKIGSDYETEEKTIEGYTLIETPENATGTMTEDTIVVTYVYKKKPTSVIVKYVDKEGNELASSVTINGKVNDEYKTVAKTIKGYTLTETPKNAKGTMTEETIVVTYVYDKETTPKQDPGTEELKTEKIYTGDEQNTTKYVVMIIISLAVILGIFTYKTSKRNKKNKKNK